jgi:hypothetical protein
MNLVIMNWQERLIVVTYFYSKGLVGGGLRCGETSREDKRNETRNYLWEALGLCC